MFTNTASHMQSSVSWAAPVGAAGLGARFRNGPTGLVCLHDPSTVTERNAPLWISLRGDDTRGAGGQRGGWPGVFKMATGKPFPTMLPIPAAPRCRRVLCEAECGRHIAVMMGCRRDEQHTQHAAPHSAVSLFCSAPGRATNSWLGLVKPTRLLQIFATVLFAAGGRNIVDAKELFLLRS